MLLLVPKSVTLDEECVPVSLISNAARETSHESSAECQTGKGLLGINAFASAGTAREDDMEFSPLNSSHPQSLGFQISLCTGTSFVCDLPHMPAYSCSGAGSNVLNGV